MPPEIGLRGHLGIADGQQRAILPERISPRFAGGLDITSSPHSGFYQEALNAFPLARLRDIKQLSIGLMYRPTPAPDKLVPKEYVKTRWDHTFEVAAITEAILTQNGFNSEEVKLGIAAALLHDIATPAFGDATMKVDIKRLDEEEHWRSVIGEQGEAFLTRHGLDPEVIHKTIVNGGIFGKVLDIADRISYVISDTDAIDRTEVDKSSELLRHFAAYPDIGGIFQDVRIARAETEENQVYFANPQRLQAFLRHRALLRRDLCDNPYSFGRDVVTGTIVRRILDAGVTPQELREMTDDDLAASYFKQQSENVVWTPGLRSGQEDLQVQRSVQYQISRFVPSVERFLSEDELGERAAQIARERDTIILGTHHFTGFKTGTDYKVVDPGSGGIRTFKDFDPQGAEEIAAIEKETHGYYLFYKQVLSRTKVPSILEHV
jgi:hypothetical protein